jgi:hypothetical protein
MTVAFGQIIEASDYNTIRAKIAEVMGVGSASYGYGQNLISDTVEYAPYASIPSETLQQKAKRQITKAQWDALRFDLINARVHQLDAVPGLIEISTTDFITSGGGPASQYNSMAEQARTDKFLLAPGQSTITSPTSQTRSTAWANSVSCTLTVTFTTADQARYFWNSGGRIRFASSRTGGTNVAQNTAWTNLLDAAGAADFSAASSTLSVYGLTTSYQTWKTSSSSSPYSNNNYRIQVKSDIENSSGTARIFYFNIVWTDGYTDPGQPAPGDQIDGTLSLSVTEIRASGALYPELVPGSFAITPPTYSITSISGS